MKLNKVWDKVKKAVKGPFIGTMPLEQDDEANFGWRVSDIARKTDKHPALIVEARKQLREQNLDANSNSEIIRVIREMPVDDVRRIYLESQQKIAEQYRNTGAKNIPDGPVGTV